ncbi:ATP-dependent Lhr-like helicase [Roseiarcus fermentans]|uniref:ATP-dependent Lhr-like helicase n=1 Tax=Roseiarcus fermentans TaxID=1473586 RepID=A0A366EMF8_9HYPH|nr:ligase-associated DNA damage response DEXH box helicase [Roseiarcus fermentans]RBP03464.1 ATP-dependent Lhr-like helicase [Roseiarcus fermentans]
MAEARAAAVVAWLAERGWTPFPFQRETWALMRARRAGLLHATTGTGKTLAAALGAWLAYGDDGARRPLIRPADAGHLPPEGEGVASPAGVAPLPQGEGGGQRPPGEGSAAQTNIVATASHALALLWITPMRALAADTERALREAFAGVAARDPSGAPAWTVGARTGDTSAAERARQARSPPSALVTTPESLALMLSRPDARETFAGLRCVVVDEWHELIGNKRGVLTQLGLARLRGLRPGLPTWGLSATLGNLGEALRALLGPQAAGQGALVEARIDKPLIVDTLLPRAPGRFPWAGHLGAAMAAAVVAEIEAARTTLVFTNVRSQAELWYQSLLKLRPDWAGAIALHHGSLARETRDWVEQGLKAGTLKAVVCTSSLDLGVDFLPVERVLQVGSPKGVARLLQRAGRSGHAPGRVSRVTIVPSHALELIEAAAVRAAIRDGRIESRKSPDAPLDVLAQHCVTVALGGGFVPEDLLVEVRTTAAYAALSDEAWRWCLDFVSKGGPTLKAYPGFRRVVPGADGVWRVVDRDIAHRHRLNIGAIVSDAAVVVQYGPAPRGAKLGSVEEGFVARMRAGQRFWFGGRILEFVRLEAGTAFVKAAKGGGTTPAWAGGRMPLSTTLADAMVEAFARAAKGDYDSPELAAARPMLEVQAKWSALPTPSTLLAETLTSREGWRLFVYPFAGRDIHLGLASLVAWRAARAEPGTFSLSVNDYGFEILSGSSRDWAALLPDCLAPAPDLAALTAEVVESLNAGELARRRFRDIAHIAGLVVAGYPGQRKSAKTMQASSGLFYDVFRKYDPDNGLLRQAEREALDDELDVKRLMTTLDAMAARRLDLRPLERATPLAFPLMVERFREQLSNETLTARIERMLGDLNAAADA